jgi:type I restriction enzyme S subunit
MTALGPLPAYWQVVRLGEVAETKSGGTPDRKRDEYFGGQIPWVKSGELRDAAIEFTEESLTELGLLNSSARIFPKGTLLVAMYGATTGKVGLLKINAATNQAVCAIFPHKEMSSEYLFYTFIRRRDELLTERYGGAQPNISQTVLKNFPIPLPPLPEQRAIAHVLRAVQRAQEASERVIAALRELKRSLMRHLSTYGPVPLDRAAQVPLQETELGPLPAHWRVVRLGEVVEILDHIRIPLNEKERQRRKGIYPYCGANGILDFIDDYLFDGEFVLLAEDEGYWGACEQSAYIMQGKFWVNNHAHVLKGIPDKLDNWFLMHVLHWMDISMFISGTTRGKLSQGVMRNLPIPLPPLSEQREIARILQAVDRGLAAEEAQVRAAQELFRSLLHQLMSARRQLPASFVARVRQEEPRVSV